MAVFTTFMNDHQNYYGSTNLTTGKNGMERYFADKANIFKFQTKDQVLIAGSQVAQKIKLAKPRAQLIIPKQSLLQGQHREYNAALAAAAARSSPVARPIPINAEPAEDIITLMSAKSTLTMPG